MRELPEGWKLTYIVSRSLTNVSVYATHTDGTQFYQYAGFEKSGRRLPDDEIRAKIEQAINLVMNEVETYQSTINLVEEVIAESVSAPETPVNDPLSLD